MPPRMTGYDLEEIRRRHGLSQDHFAAILQVSPTTVRRLELYGPEQVTLRMIDRVHDSLAKLDDAARRKGVDPSAQRPRMRLAADPLNSRDIYAYEIGRLPLGTLLYCWRPASPNFLPDRWYLNERTAEGFRPAPQRATESLPAEVALGAFPER